MIFIWFIYGLAFFVLGLVIVIYPKKPSMFKLANHIWLIAGFGLRHGGRETSDELCSRELSFGSFGCDQSLPQQVGSSIPVLSQSKDLSAYLSAGLPGSAVLSFSSFFFSSDALRFISQLVRGRGGNASSRCLIDAGGPAFWSS